MQVLIVGAGGHGKVVLDALRAGKEHKPAGFIDSDPGLRETRVGGLPVFGSSNMLRKLRQQKIAHAIVAIGDNRTRKKYMALLAEHDFELINAIHPFSSVSKTASLGRNVFVAAGAVVGPESRIADGVIVNTGAIVDHECIVEEMAHLCPGSRLAGRVRVGPCAFVGLGANVIQCLSIGESAIIGAGAAVIGDVPPFATAVGVPARVIKIEIGQLQATEA